MPGFNRPDFPEVPDSKVTIGEHRDGGPLRVTDIYQEIGSLSNEPALHDQILTPAIVPETMEQKITNAINDFLESPGLKKAIDLTNAPKPPKEMMDQAKKALAGARTARRAAKNGKPASSDEQLIKALSLYLKENVCKKCGKIHEDIEKGCVSGGGGGGAAAAGPSVEMLG